MGPWHVWDIIILKLQKLRNSYRKSRDNSLLLFTTYSMSETPGILMSDDWPRIRSHVIQLNCPSKNKPLLEKRMSGVRHVVPRPVASASPGSLPKCRTEDPPRHADSEIPMIWVLVRTEIDMKRSHLQLERNYEWTMHIGISRPVFSLCLWTPKEMAPCGPRQEALKYLCIVRLDL